LADKASFAIVRNMYVRELKNAVSAIKGTGPKIENHLNQLGIFTIADLLTYYPRDYEDRSEVVPLKDFANKKVNTIATVLSHEWFGYGRMKTLKILIEDDTAQASLICFNRSFLKDSLAEGSTISVFGTFTVKYSEIQSSAFDAEVIQEGITDTKGIIPVYPLCAGLKQGTIRTIMHRALESYAKHLESELPPSLQKELQFVSKAEALFGIHKPQNLIDLSNAKKALIFEELFYLQLMIALRRQNREENKVTRKETKGLLSSRLLDRLPFKLTQDQEKVFSEIQHDLKSAKPMGRLLQGDVGSGKTLIAFLAALEAIEAGGQAVIMAPTELLARQHAENAAKLLEPLGVRLAFLTGNIRDSGRKALLQELMTGGIDLIIGTHALFSSDVVYKKLSLVVIDEQHRFGVMQRIALSAKGTMADLLMMSATPIPRTLALTNFGDLDVSEIKSMPAGRKPIVTHLALHSNEQKVYDYVRRELEKGRQAYFVYPLIEKSDSLEIKNATEMFETLKNDVFKGYSVDLVHSKLDDDAKIKVMDSFKEGKLSILVATSVVEVGVDVPNASCMIIEQAERFGLSALHQLRGRVGRGTEQSYCFLVYSKDLTEEAKSRLKIMLETTDGFAIAEEDLRIRGPGEISGLEQSGRLMLTIADPIRDKIILTEARNRAFSLIDADPHFLSPDNKPIKEILERCPPFTESLSSRA